jgi:tRNA-specific 2-thiouridylase
MAKARYKAEEVPATLEPAGGLVRIRFDEPQRAVTPGQSIVFYDGDVVVGGGTLERDRQAARAGEAAVRGV